MPTNDLHTALADQWGVHRKHWVRVMEMLEQHPAWVEEADEYGYLPAHLVSAFGGRREVVHRIISMYPEAATMLNQGNWLPLHFAACWGNKDAVELLIQVFPDGAYFKDNDRRRPIDRAREMRRTDIVAVLQPLEAGYDAWRSEHPELAADEGEEEEDGAAQYGSIDPADIERLQRLEAEDHQVFLELRAQERAAYDGQVGDML